MQLKANLHQISFT